VHSVSSVKIFSCAGVIAELKKYFDERVLAPGGGEDLSKDEPGGRKGDLQKARIRMLNKGSSALLQSGDLRLLKR